MDHTMEELEEALRREKQFKPIHLTRNEQNLLELIKMRREFFEKINDPNAQKVKSGLPGDFLYESEYFKIALGLLETAAALFKLPQIANSFAKELNEMIEKYNPSPDVTRHFNKIMNGGADPNEIKLNVEKNIYEQLKELKVTDSTDEKILTYADYIDEKTLTYARYLDKRSHFIPMELPDGKFLFLDISRYYRDREQHLAKAPHSGPQESNQEQSANGPQESYQKQPFAEGPQAREGILKSSPTPNSSPERPPENQEKRSEEKTPTGTLNYLPTPLPKKGVKFAGGVKEKDGKKGWWGQWVEDKNASSRVPNQR